MGFEEDLRRLQPLVGQEKVLQLWRAYQLEEAGGRREMESAIALQLERLTGADPLSSEHHLRIPLARDVQGDFEFGPVIAGNRVLHPFGLREDEFIQHVAIFGRSGAGKTNTVALLIKQLVNHQKPFMIFDWKRNYRDLLRGSDPVPLEVYTVGRKIRPLHFNPLIPPPSTDIKVWMKKLIEIISHAYYLGEGVMFMLQEAFDRVYQECGCYEQPNPETFPTMKDVLDHLQTVSFKGRKAMWLDSTLRAVQSLCFGQISDVINVECNDSILDLLNRNVCLELNSLGNSEKVFLIETLMVWIHHLRMLETDRETFKHCVIIEEAHNILSPAGKETIIDTLLREVRELGESIVLVDQHPSQISIPALGNTYCTIALNMKHSKDINALAEIMNIARENREIFGTMAMGRAIVKLQSRYVHPFQIQIPKVEIAKGSVTDTHLAQMFLKASDSTDSTMESELKASSGEIEEFPSSRKVKAESAPITELEKRLMEDIRNHPLDGVVRRYHRLEVSRRRGDHAKKSLIAKKVIKPVEVPTKNGKVVLLDFTEDMRAAFKRNNVSMPAPRRGGLVHLYWVDCIAKELESLGWTTIQEASLGNGEAVDIAASKGESRIAVEVETGERGAKNIARLLKHNYDWIITFSTSDEVEAQTKRAMQKGDIHANHVLFAKPADIQKKLQFLNAKTKSI